MRRGTARPVQLDAVQRPGLALALCLLLLGVGACSIGQPQVSKLVTPPDPPPVPRAKPLPPSHMQLATVTAPAAQSTMVWQAPPA